MKIHKAFLLLSLISMSCSSFAASPAGMEQLFSEENQEPKEILVHNRILARVNGKPITVVDVIKQMDFIFYRRFPDLVSSLPARYQFYMMNWRAVFDDMVENELIVADATEKKIPISEGDIREELESLFGPDVVLNIDKIDLTYDEAWAMMKKEVTVRRMTTMMVRMKAMQLIHPKDIRKGYEEWALGQTKNEKWSYQILAIKGKSENEVQTLSQMALNLLSEQKIAFDQLPKELKVQAELCGAKITLSEDYERVTKDLSLAHKAVLQTVQMGCASTPVIQKQKDSQYLARLFYLKDLKEDAVPVFNKMEDKIERELLRQAMEKESAKYMAKLKKHYGINDQYLKTMIPENFQPFTLR